MRRFTSGKTLADYRVDDLLRSAVERQFKIVGEAMNKLAGVDEGTARQITNFQRIIAFRNILIHGYADLDDSLVWNISGDLSAPIADGSQRPAGRLAPVESYSVVTESSLPSMAALKVCHASTAHLMRVGKAETPDSISRSPSRS